MPFGLFDALVAAIDIGSKSGAGSLRRHAADATLFAEVAARLGLEVRGHEAVVEHGEGPLIASYVANGPERFSTVTAPLSPPLDIGLLVEGKPRAVHVSEDDAKAFGRSVLARGDEPERVEALLRPKLLGALDAAAAAAEVIVTDSAVTVMERSRPTAKFYDDAITTAAELRERVLAAAKRTPPAAQLARTSSAYRHVAESRGLVRTRTPLGIWTADGKTRLVVARRAAGTFTATVFSSLELLRGEAVSAAGATELWLRSRELPALRLEDKGLDALMARTRAMGTLRVFQGRVSLDLEAPPPAPEAVGLLDLVAELASMIEAAVILRNSRGAYR